MTRRSPAWGAADPPMSDGEARSRLLEAAEACFRERGPLRTKITHVAAKAGVHRTTVYKYFSGMDEILMACFIKATDAVVEAAEPYFRQDAPFVERLIRAALAGLQVARTSPTMRSMTTPDVLAHTHQLAERSETWRAEVVDRLAERFTTAAPGEVRTDVSPHVLAQWVVRLCFSLIEEPAGPEFGGDEGLLRTFLPRTIAP
ncbi:bacterial regulatory s, tetR family protein [Mycolicibacterium hassiacum DSM 44199]|jgi:AcrR family transcriptional regulator|uniref:Bacterial regulatory s, tetR family protein n=1 Tax=Mycolicibacterium hassiacum (strain DSM 44199 / CIP 105218 / JCM 12690 / 3849) TaxID=1122247 RepID=K5BDS6_MYCHD|nr:TetR/AcrR family transcriptional regulator [Mycolicibacterium hassiacum]EKF21671.1 bacterial regulatory s, tetR family protein [Mycolicibacterium hassiacum DSM 44199]MBX5487485.1 TetR/AcrR family transcriptional regulator [Mycolicibacterium hassiacum]MDA4084239.1 TetR family transcriptional regulator [Mycolicibacterium hassiacum DSM 44199]PZN25073.1 MAG: TetR/AcrR family transcriptional regulator [Mycolicibacterium hassiacum]VCT91248.1 putative HTH-type transcriptional regulator [Mycoliciba